MVCPNIPEYPLEFWLSPDCLAISENAEADENVL